MRINLKKAPHYFLPLNNGNYLISYEIFSAMIFFKYMINLLLIIDEPFIYWLSNLLRLLITIIHIIIIQKRLTLIHTRLLKEKACIWCINA